jgi:quercetin dioxygenase-like cupin family protein
MGGMFVPAAEVVRQQLDWGWLAWCSRPADTGAENLVVIEVTLAPGGGHAFHKHPQQEELIYVVEGQVEQWREDEQRMMQPGDAVFLPAGTVHASFNTSQRDAKLLAILSPSIGGDDGYEVFEVADQPPWNGLR